MGVTGEDSFLLPIAKNRLNRLQFQKKVVSLSPTLCQKPITAGKTNVLKPMLVCVLRYE